MSCYFCGKKIWFWQGYAVLEVDGVEGPLSHFPCFNASRPTTPQSRATTEE